LQLHEVVVRLGRQRHLSTLKIYYDGQLVAGVVENLSYMENSSHLHIVIM